jgi:hypothetical protein
MQSVICQHGVENRAKRRSRADQKHLPLLNDFRTAVETLLRVRDWRGVPADIAGHWQGLQAALIEGRGLWLQASKWPEPDRLEILAMWRVLALLRFVMPSDGQLIVLMSAGIRIKKLAEYRNEQMFETIAAFERAIQEIADNLAREQAA